MVVKNQMKIEKKSIALIVFILAVCLTISAIAYTTAQILTDDIVPEEQTVTTFDDNETETEVLCETEQFSTDPLDRLVIASREDGKGALMTLREYYAIYGDNTPLPSVKMYYETEDGTLVEYSPYEKPKTHKEDGTIIKYKLEMKSYCIIGDRPMIECK
jgi:hypothetical protein